MIHIYKDTLNTAQPTTQAAPSGPKMPNVQLQEVTDKMSKGQKQGIELWNKMVTTLIQNGLMEEN